MAGLLARLFACCAAPTRRGDPGDPRQRGGRRVDRRARDARQADDLRARGDRRRRWPARCGSPPTITFQPKTYFSPQWTAYMIFMVLVGGLGTFEGADPRRRGVLRASKPGSAPPASGISSASAPRRWCSRSPFRAASGAGSRIAPGCACCRSATAFASAPKQTRRRRATPRRPEANKTRRQASREMGGDGCCSARRSSSPESPQASARASANWRAALGADVIGVDSGAAKPAAARSSRPTSLRRQPAPIWRAPCPAAFDALCNVAGVSGVLGGGQDAGDQFLWLARAERSAGAAAARGWRNRQRRLDRRLRLARQSRARQGLRRPAGLCPTSPRSSPASMCPRARAIPLSKELLLLWTMRAAHSPPFRGRAHPRQRRQPGPGDDADPERVPRRSLATRASTTTSRASGRAGIAVRHRAGGAVPVLGRRALDQRRQPAGRWRAGGFGQRQRPRILIFGRGNLGASETRRL